MRFGLEHEERSFREWVTENCLVSGFSPPTWSCASSAEEDPPGPDWDDGPDPEPEGEWDEPEGDSEAWDGWDEAEGLSVATAGGGVLEPPGPGDGQPSDTAPRGVTRGVKCQVGIDWLRFVGPADQKAAAVEIIRSEHGEPVPASGFHFYRQGSAFPSGVRVCWDSRSESSAGTFMVEVPGGVLSLMNADLRLCFAGELMRLPGMKCRRVDVAGDLRDESQVGLIASVIASCQRDELTGLRRWEERHPKVGSRTVGRSVYLGRRGAKNGAGRMVRIYDKGLETKTEPEGRWERCEVEFSGEVADKALRALLAEVEWVPVAWDLILGAVDFRENTGDRHIQRRRRVGWWAAFVDQMRTWEGDTLRRYKVEPRESSLPSYQNWLAKQVVPRLAAMAKATDFSMVDVFLDLVPGVPSRRRASIDPVVFEYVRRIEQRAAWVCQGAAVPF